MQQKYGSELSKDAPVFSPTIATGFDSNAQLLPNQFNSMYMNYGQQPTTGFGNYGMNSAAAATYSTPTATTTTQNVQNHFDVYAQPDGNTKAPVVGSNATNGKQSAADESADSQYLVSANNYGRHPNVSMPTNVPNTTTTTAIPAGGNGNSEQPQQTTQSLLPTHEPAVTDFRTAPNAGGFENLYGSFNQQQTTQAQQTQQNQQQLNQNNTNNYFGAQQQNNYGGQRQNYGRKNNFNRNNRYQNNRYGGANNYNQGYGGGYRNNYNNRRGGGRGGGYGGRGGFRQQPMYWRETGPRHSEYEGMVKASKNRDEQLEKRVFGTPTVSQGINFDDYDKVKVKVGNYGGFTPLTSFEDANFDPLLMENISKCRFQKPTPIQKYTIPPACAGKDIMACAQTGSGKTAAFLLPVVHNLLSDPNTEARAKNPYGQRKAFPKAVIISPTRELAQQIHKDCLKFVYRAGLGTACVFGGSSIEKQSNYFNHTIHILTATVGRLWDFHTRGNISFEQVDYFVLDEADRMLDMGFEKDIMNIIYNSDMKAKRTNLLFSATLPREIQELASSFLDDYVFLACGRVGAVGHLITQQFEYVEQQEKTNRLIELLMSIEGRSLVFTATKRKADELEHQLNSLRQRIRCVAIHGDKSQRAREKALKQFRDNRISVMIATDVAARGLDIPDVAYVLQYDTPDNIDSYVHRIGRTGRCGNKGTAISFLNDNNKPILRPLMKLLNDEKAEIPPWLVQLHQKHGNSNMGNKKRWYGRKPNGNFRGGRRGGGRGRYNNNRRNNYRNNQNRGPGGGRGRGRGGQRQQQHGNFGGANNFRKQNNYQNNQNLQTQI